MVDHHDTIPDPHLVRMGSGCHVDPGQLARPFRIGHVEDGGAARRLHVTDEGRRALDPDLSAAGAVETANLLQP